MIIFSQSGSRMVTFNRDDNRVIELESPGFKSIYICDAFGNKIAKYFASQLAMRNLLVENAQEYLESERDDLIVSIIEGMEAAEYDTLKSEIDNGTRQPYLGGGPEKWGEI